MPTCQTLLSGAEDPYVLSSETSSETLKDFSGHVEAHRARLRETRVGGSDGKTAVGRESSSDPASGKPQPRRLRIEPLGTLQAASASALQLTGAGAVMLTIQGSSSRTRVKVILLSPQQDLCHPGDTPEGLYIREFLHWVKVGGSTLRSTIPWAGVPGRVKGRASWAPAFMTQCKWLSRSPATTPLQGGPYLQTMN